MSKQTDSQWEPDDAMAVQSGAVSEDALSRYDAGSTLCPAAPTAASKVHTSIRLASVIPASIRAVREGTSTMADVGDYCGEPIEWWRSHTALRSSRWLHSKTQRDSCEHAYATPSR